MRGWFRAAGRPSTSRRCRRDRGFHELVGEFANDVAEVLVGIETDRGLWVTELVALGYQVYAINPLAASRYRVRHNVAVVWTRTRHTNMLLSALRES